MPECAICGGLVDKVYVCRICGAKFCENDGSSLDRICINCSEKENERIETKHEEEVEKEHEEEEWEKEEEERDEEEEREEEEDISN